MDHPQRNALPAKAPDSTPTTSPAQRAEDSETSPADTSCYLCHGTGVMRWTQMCPDGVLRELEHPCIHGCSGWWKQPAAEADVVVEVVDAQPVDGPE